MKTIRVEIEDCVIEINIEDAEYERIQKIIKDNQKCEIENCNEQYYCDYCHCCKLHCTPT